MSTGAGTGSDPKPHFQMIVNDLSSCSLLGFALLCPGSSLIWWQLLNIVIASEGDKLWQIRFKNGNLGLCYTSGALVNKFWYVSGHVLA